MTGTLCNPCLRAGPGRSGGGRGIRTPDALSGITVFKTAGFNRSPIPPRLSYQQFSSMAQRGTRRRSHERHLIYIYTNVMLWMLGESQIEGYPHLNDSDVRHQSCPEMVSEDHCIYRDDDGYHRHHIKYGNHRSCHCDLPQILRLELLTRDSSCGPFGCDRGYLALLSMIPGPVRPASVGVDWNVITTELRKRRNSPFRN